MPGPGRPKGSTSVAPLPCGCRAAIGPKTHWKIRKLKHGVRICEAHNRAFVQEWREVGMDEAVKIAERKDHGPASTQVRTAPRRVFVQRPVSARMATKGSGA